MKSKVLVAFFVLLLASASLCAGCGEPPEGSPAWVVQEYLKAIEDKDATAAYSFLYGYAYKGLPFETFETCVAHQVFPTVAGLRVSYSGDEACVEILPGNRWVWLEKKLDSWKIYNLGGGGCIDNLRTIDGCIMQFNAETGCFPENIEELVPEYLREIPVCPYGFGEYFLYPCGSNGMVRAMCPFGHHY